MSERPSISIAVATHKPYRMPDDPVYLPLQVGKALHPEVDLGFATDATGESISDLNGVLSELTALYWMWKNSDAAYRGLVHYRRHFRSPQAKRRDGRFARIAGEDDFRQALERADIVVPAKRNYYIETIASHYEHTHAKEHLIETRRVLMGMCPQYTHAFDRVMHGTSAHMFNMLVMRDELLDEYCTWLFPVLFALMRRIDPASCESEFEMRYPGRISEMLLDVWIAANGYAYTELPTIIPEPVNWARKGSAFLAAKFAGSTYKKSF